MNEVVKFSDGGMFGVIAARASASRVRPFTQTSCAIAECRLAGTTTPLDLASANITAFRRDPRGGYARGFKDAHWSGWPSRFDRRGSGHGCHPGVATELVQLSISTETRNDTWTFLGQRCK
jgi:hypothetical protein